MKNTFFSLVIPAYNEEQVIVEMLESLVRVPLKFEIIIVDDGSRDQTAPLVKEFIRTHRRKAMRLFSHPYNKGYGAALKTGIRLARSDVVMFFDADGQHDSNDIESLLRPLDEYDMVVGRRINSVSPLVRRPGIRILKWIAEYLAERRIPDLNSGFRAVKKSVVERYMHILPNGFSFTTTITLALFEGGYSISFVPISVRSRKGKSSVSFRDAYKMLLLILRTITLFNPLKVFLPVAGSLFMLGFVLLVRDMLKVDITLKTVMILLSSILVFLFGLLSDQVANVRKDTHLKD